MKKPNKLYVLAVLEWVNSDDGLIAVKTGVVNGNGQTQYTEIDERLCVCLDKTLQDNILKNWHLLQNSPEYTLIQIVRKIQEKDKENT